MPLNFTITAPVLWVGLVLLWLGWLRLVRNIQFAYPVWEDTTTLTAVAAEAGRQWRWPAQMHRPERRATFMKDATIVLLALSQRLFRDRTTMYPLIALQGFANVVSAGLVFQLAQLYWSAPVAALLALLFVAASWPWQIALLMGHINVATMFFLAAIYLTALSAGAGALALWYLAAAGAVFSLLLFSSSSYVKYVGLFFAALIFARNWPVLAAGNWAVFFSVLAPGQYLWLNLAVAGGLVLLLALVLLSYRPLVAAMYQDRLPPSGRSIMARLGRDMAGRANFGLEHYQRYTGQKLRRYASWLLRLYILLAALLNFIGPLALLAFLAGMSAVALFLTLPNVKTSLGFYWFYLRENQVRQKTGFRPYTAYFAKQGIIVDRYTRSGLAWVPRMFWRMAPLPTLLGIFGLVYWSAAAAAARQYAWLPGLWLVAATALLPVLWGEMSHSPTSARNYFAGFVGWLALDGYLLNLFYRAFPAIFPAAAAGLALVYLAWNSYCFFTDILPARLTVNRLLAQLHRRGIREFFTYRTGYNSILVDALRPGVREKFTIKYISRLDEADGWVVIPATSFKTAMIPTDDILASGDDYRTDPQLNALLANREMEQLAAVKFKTFGTSRYWIQDHEAISYQDLMRHAITAADRYRSYAWLVHTDRLKTDRPS